MRLYLKSLLKSNALIKRSVRTIFDKLPFFLFKTKSYRDNIELLERFESLSGEEIRQWKFRALYKVIENAYYNVPYYARLYRQVGFHPKDFKRIEDLDKLPLISKKDIKTNLRDFMSVNARMSEMVVKYTGGSTETPMKFFVEHQQEEKEASYFDFIWRKYGYRFARDKCVVIKGDKIARYVGNKLVLSRYSPRLKSLIFDSDYLNRIEFLQLYLDDILAFGSDVLFGYPSSIYQLARTIEKSGCKAPQFRLILLASENTYDEQNRFIKDTFGAQELFFHYGHSEQVLAAYKSLNSDRLSFIPTYGHVELVKDSVNILGEDDKSVGELVGTNFSMSFPFIRFRTNDFAVNASAGESIFACGSTVNSIEGRLQEYIVSRDERLVSICTVGGGHFASIAKAIEMQYVQDIPGFLTVQIVENPEEPFSIADIEQLKSDLNAKFDFAVETSVELVGRISRSTSNKKSLILQNIDTSRYVSSDIH